MADYSTPFAENGDRRLPTANETDQGFVNGAAPRELMNQQMYELQAQIRQLVVDAGVPWSTASQTQLLDAIDAKIAAATGGGDTSNFVTIGQAIARLPIFPEIVSADNRINVTSPAAGTVRVPGGVTLMHRGINPHVSSQTDFPTVASKTYHIRWNSTDGYTIKDLSNGTYNGGALPEADTAFDTTLDDALVARVVTNSSNVATITNLANADRLIWNAEIAGTVVQNGGSNFATFDFSGTANWGRAPASRAFNLSRRVNDGDASDSDWFLYTFGTTNVESAANRITTYPTDRYGTRFTAVADFAESLTFDVSIGA